MYRITESRSNRDRAATFKGPDTAAIVDALMKDRFSCRYYLPKPVDKEIVNRIIDAARFSPSGNNMQLVYYVSVTTSLAKLTTLCNLLSDLGPRYTVLVAMSRIN